MIVADAKQAAELEHCVGYLAADLVDHDTLDLTDFLPVGPVLVRAFDHVASDEIEGFAIFHGHSTSLMLR